MTHRDSPDGQAQLEVGTFHRHFDTSGTQELRNRNSGSFSASCLTLSLRLAFDASYYATRIYYSNNLKFRAQAQAVTVPAYYPQALRGSVNDSYPCVVAHTKDILCRTLSEFSTASDGKSKLKGTRKKRKAAGASEDRDIDLPKGWMEKFLELEPTNRANILASLANEGKITVSQLKKVGMGLPSFSSAKWSELPASSNLPKNPFSSRSDSSEASDVMAGFDPVITPVLLPPSFHETIAMAAWQIQDVYQERDSQKREEARVRVFEAVC